MDLRWVLLAAGVDGVWLDTAATLPDVIRVYDEIRKQHHRQRLDFAIAMNAANGSDEARAELKRMEIGYGQR